MPPRLSLVIPTFNEALNIPRLYRQVCSILEKSGGDFEIIFVDDNSADATAEIIRGLAGQDKKVRLISRVSEKGLGTAVACGWADARGELLGVMDADLQHPPELLEDLLRQIDSQKADIVIASRYVPGGGFLTGVWQVLRSRLAVCFGFIFLPRIFRTVKDPMSGYFLLRREVVAGKTLKPYGYKILLEVLTKGNYKKTVEVPYKFLSRQAGKTKAGLRQYLTCLLYLARLRISQK